MLICKCKIQAVNSSVETADSLMVNNCHHLAKFRSTPAHLDIIITLTFYVRFSDVSRNVSKINVVHKCIGALTLT